MSTAANPFPVFVSVGEALTDLLIDEQRADIWHANTGGAPWNVARAMAALSVPSAFAGAISCDLFGDALWNASRDAGLDLRFIQRVGKSPLLAIVHSTRPPRYFFIGDDSADLHFATDALPFGWQTAVRWAHFGGISLARAPLAGRLAELAGQLKARGVRISYDPNFRVLMDEAYDPMLRQMTRLADLVKVSDEDLDGLFRSRDNGAALATLRSWNPGAMILLTHGSAGASLFSKAEGWSAAPPPVTVSDSVGAGDACVAALIASLMNNAAQPLQDHLRFAVAAGAAACEVPGACPPRLDAIEELLRQTPPAKSAAMPDASWPPKDRSNH